MNVAWVTGAGTGIGRALAFLLAERGMAVVISGRRREPLEDTTKAIQAKFPGARISAVVGDVADPNHAPQAVGEAARLGQLTVLINNAGSNPNHPFEETTPEEFRQTFEANCLGAILCAKAALPALRASGGSIVNVGSVLGKWASRGSAAYSVAKYAVTGLTDLLRQELINSPVHVLGVYPGFIRTPMTEPFVEKGSVREKVGKTPDDMARAILKALDRKAATLHYPWYVSWLLVLHRWAPKSADRFARRMRG